MDNINWEYIMEKFYLISMGIVVALAQIGIKKPAVEFSTTGSY